MNIIVLVLDCLGVVLLLTALYMAFRLDLQALKNEANDALVNSLAEEKDLIRKEHNRSLGIARIALEDIKNQGDLDRQYKVWAKKRASDTLELLDRQ